MANPVFRHWKIQPYVLRFINIFFGFVFQEKIATKKQECIMNLHGAKYYSLVILKVDACLSPIG